MNVALKSALEQLFSICDSNVEENKVNYSSEREELKKECINYLSYLSASDGTISKYEAEFIQEYFDYVISAEDLRLYIDTNNTYTTEFESKVPDVLMRLLKRDNGIYSRDKELSLSVSEAYISVFECLGKEFLACDGEVTQDEVNDLTTYTTMLREYKKRKLLFQIR